MTRLNCVDAETRTLTLTPMNKADQIIQSVITGEMLLEMPQHYQGDVTYQKDSKFTRISIGNFKRYTVLHQDLKYVYTLGPVGSFGHVFVAADVHNPPALGMIPVMSVELRDTDIKGYKQAHHLRIRESQSSRGVATTWYCKYVDFAGGIVSDFEHLEGGKIMWRSFVNAAADRGYMISLYDTQTGESVPVSGKTPDFDIWSEGPEKRHLVLVMERP